jgi:hypothetical protein
MKTPKKSFPVEFQRAFSISKLQDTCRKVLPRGHTFRLKFSHLYVYLLLIQYSVMLFLRFEISQREETMKHTGLLRITETV